MRMRPNTPERIAAAARKILEREGPEAVSMRRVAAAVGITPMAIYHHFPDRAGLLKSITDQEFDRLLGFIRKREAEQGPPDELLIRLMDGYIDYALAQPRIFDFVFTRKREGARRFPHDFHARKSPTLNAVADALSREMGAKRLRPDDVWEIALELWALVHGYVVLYRADRFAMTEAQFRELCRTAIRRLIRGLAA